MKFLSIMVFVILVSACSKDDGSGPKAATIQDLQGTWKLSSITCNNLPATISGLNEQITVSGSTSTTVESTSSCTITISNSNLTQSGPNIASSGGSVVCSPANCALNYNIAINGQTQAVTRNCSDFPVLSPAVAYYINGNVVTDSETVASGVTCTASAVKQ